MYKTQEFVTAQIDEYQLLAGNTYGLLYYQFPQLVNQPQVIELAQYLQRGLLELAQNPGMAEQLLIQPLSENYELNCLGVLLAMSANIQGQALPENQYLLIVENFCQQGSTGDTNMDILLTLLLNSQAV